jgi:hypothetical protein
MTAAAKTECRRCSECRGEAHHFLGPEMVDCPVPSDGDIVFICKHCPYTCVAVDCAACSDYVPIDVATKRADGSYICPFCVEPESSGQLAMRLHQ